MCQLKSGIILKNRVFVPEYDSHTEMLDELGIKDDYFNASKTFVRVELSPTGGDVFSDIDTWRLRVDQDITPEWYDEDTYKPQVVEAGKAWAKDHIHIGVDNLKVGDRVRVNAIYRTEFQQDFVNGKIGTIEKIDYYPQVVYEVKFDKPYTYFGYVFPNDYFYEQELELLPE